MKCGHNKLLLRSISYSYGRKDDFKIRELTLSIPEKTISAVIGKNGSGKTTLLLLMLGYIKPTYGQVGFCINGKYIPAERANGRIAYLPQNEEIPKEYTVNDFLLLGRIPFIGSFSQPSRKDYSIIEDVKEKLEIQHIGKKKLGQISGGELQRVRIGRALVQEAHLILFDEPITHLDIGTKLKIISILKDLKRLRTGVIKQKAPGGNTFPLGKIIFALIRPSTPPSIAVVQRPHPHFLLSESLIQSSIPV